MVKNIRVRRQNVGFDRRRVSCAFYVKTKIKFELNNESVVYDLETTSFKLALNKGVYFKGNSLFLNSISVIDSHRAEVYNIEY